MVKEGDVLFVIDPRPTEAAWTRPRRELARARPGSIGQPSAHPRGALVRAIPCRRRPTTSGCRRCASPKAPCNRRPPRCRPSELISNSPEVKAPLSGRVRPPRRIGNLIDRRPEHATLLTTIVSLDPIYFTFDMSESDFLAYQRA